jgi:hypothetical protein
MNSELTNVCCHRSSIRNPEIVNEIQSRYVFKRVRKIVCLSVCLSACNNSAPTGLIFTKLHIREFFENLSRKFTFY